MSRVEQVAIVRDKNRVNSKVGHLRIDVGEVDNDGEFWTNGTYAFMSGHVDGLVQFGALSGPSGLLDADSLDAIAAYCSERADAIRARATHEGSLPEWEIAAKTLSRLSGVPWEIIASDHRAAQRAITRVMTAAAHADDAQAAGRVLRVSAE